MDALIRAEFHTHTCYSHDSLVKIDDFLDTCNKKGLDRVAITDHNEIKGAFIAKELDPERVIVGEEIQTTQGEMLGYFIKNHIPAGLTPMQTIEALKAQDAFISIAHPFDPHRGTTWSESSLAEISPYIDAIEIFNARCLSNRANLQAEAYARKHHLAGMVGSDAHSLYELGRASLLLPAFDDADSLRKALVSARRDDRLSGTWVHLISLYAKIVKRISKPH